MFFLSAAEKAILMIRERCAEVTFETFGDRALQSVLKYQDYAFRHHYQRGPIS